MKYINFKYLFRLIRKSKIAISLFLFTVLVFNTTIANAQKKPNIIFISVDDMGINFDAYGNTNVPCPNMARLASHGVMFKKAYLSYPLCSPNRNCVLSGYRTDKNGVSDNIQNLRSGLGPDFRFLNEYYHDSGYFTVKYGKYTCEHESEISWDKRANVTKEEVYPGLQQQPFWWIDTTAKSEFETRNGSVASQVIKDLKKPYSTPYFYAMGFTTHNPFSPTLYEWNLIGDSSTKIQLPIDKDGTFTNVYGNGSSTFPLPFYPETDTDDIPEIAKKDPVYYSIEEQQNIRHAYFSEMVGMDIQLGRLLDQMDSLRLWDSTIIVFYSDNGLHMGEHLGLWLKTTLFNESLRIPLVICAPGIKSGMCNELVELVDIYPTLNELCNMPLDPDFEGISLVPLLQKPDLPWKTAVFSDIRKTVDAIDTLMGRAVNTKEFHYNSWQTEGEELYDVINDSMEITNLVGNPEYADTLQKMREILAAGWQSVKPPTYLQNIYFKDNDNDSYGNSNQYNYFYFPPSGYVTKQGDCNDNNGKIYPGSIEQICNGIDDNCNNQIDENRPIPIIIPQSGLDICSTGSVLLKTNSGNGLQYQWYKDGVKINGATRVSYKAVAKGKYTVMVKIKTGCGNTSDTTNVTSSCLGSTQNSNLTLINANSSISIYPSPSRGKITVRYDNINKAEKISIHISNAEGKMVSAYTKPAVAGANLFYLDLSFLASGLYTLDINNLKSLKFLIER